MTTTLELHADAAGFLAQAADHLALDPVHLTGQNDPSYGAVRLGPVYTPREHRGCGYASAAVAELSGRVLAAGHRPCLFTDQANPVSNGVYERIGYAPVVDMVNLLVGAPVPDP